MKLSVICLFSSRSSSLHCLKDPRTCVVIDLRNCGLSKIIPYKFSVCNFVQEFYCWDIFIPVARFRLKDFRYSPAHELCRCQHSLRILTVYSLTHYSLHTIDTVLKIHKIRVLAGKPTGKTRTKRVYRHNGLPLWKVCPFRGLAPSQEFFPKKGIIIITLSEILHRFGQPGGVLKVCFDLFVHVIEEKRNLHILSVNSYSRISRSNIQSGSHKHAPLLIPISFQNFTAQPPPSTLGKQTYSRTSDSYPLPL